MNSRIFIWKRSHHGIDRYCATAYGPPLMVLSSATCEFLILSFDSVEFLVVSRQGVFRPVLGRTAGAARWTLARTRSLMSDAHRQLSICVVVWNSIFFARSVYPFTPLLESVKEQGIEFVSFSGRLHQYTAGRLSSQSAPWRNSSVRHRERVKPATNANARSARAGPNASVERTQAPGYARALRLEKISREMGIGVGTPYRLAREGPNSEGFLNPHTNWAEFSIL